MTLFWRIVLAIAWKDVLLELRTKDIVPSLLIFSLLVAIIFNFALDPTSATVALVVPGMLWVAFTFASMLGLNRTFVLEKERGSLMGLMLGPVGRDAIYFGKLFGVLVFMLIVELLIYPLFAVMFDLPLFLPQLAAVAFLVTLGFAAAGTVFSAMATNTHSREVMLPVLFFPIAIPVIIAAVEASGGVLEGVEWGELGKWFQLIAVFDILLVVASCLTFEYVLEE